MSTRKHTPRSRVFRPEADDLESRRLLSAVVSGTDSKGDTWTLRLIGPGTLTVVKQDDSSGAPAALDSATDINSITVGGTDPETSRLVGTVTPGPNSDGRVFFDQFSQLATRSEKYPNSGNGLLSIDMPDFWLGNTTPTGQTATSAPAMNIPDGVDTLDFGGVDTTYNQPTPTSSSTNDMDVVSLGLPLFGGTRIIINKSVSSTQQAPPASGSTTSTTIQHGVTFAVSGRLDLFQANEIDGDAAHPPGQYKDLDSNASGSGGTTLFVTTPGEQSTYPFLNNLFPNPATMGGVTGQIGLVRVGGNATNFATYVFDPTLSGGDKIANYSVGGETDNVEVVAPSGARNFYFGEGMDTVDIFAHVINDIQANRGAVSSNVYADRSISRVDLGGDVVGTKILAGYNQNYDDIFDNVLGVATSAFSAGTPTAPPTPQNAQPFGGMTVHVAGDVSNSVFAASDQPFNDNFTQFGNPNDALLTGGRINAKIEGTINNSVLAPNTPQQAVFAAHTTNYTGPVVPPNVPEEPYSGSALPARLPGIDSATIAPTLHTNLNLGAGTARQGSAASSSKKS